MKKKLIPFAYPPIGEYFGLSYAHWLVLPRVILEEMPGEWQRKFLKLLREVDETFDWMPKDLQIYVTMRRKGKMVKLPEHLCEYRRPQPEDIEAMRIPTTDAQ